MAHRKFVSFFINSMVMFHSCLLTFTIGYSLSVWTWKLCSFPEGPVDEIDTLWAETFPETTFVWEQSLYTKRSVGKNGHAAHPWNQLSSCFHLKFNQFTPFQAISWAIFHLLGQNIIDPWRYDMSNICNPNFMVAKPQHRTIKENIEPSFLKHFCRGTEHLNSYFAPNCI